MLKFGEKQKVVVVSGGFDPIHIGHVRLMNEAKSLGTRLVVILNNDAWLMKKKGYVFMNHHDRKEIIENLKSVDEVILSEHTHNNNDMSVCRELQSLKPHVFANGGDRWEDNIPEVELCKRMHIETVFNIGKGGKVRSSSELVKNARHCK